MNKREINGNQWQPGKPENTFRHLKHSNVLMKNVKRLIMSFKRLRHLFKPDHQIIKLDHLNLPNPNLWANTLTDLYKVLSSRFLPLLRCCSIEWIRPKSQRCETNQVPFWFWAQRRIPDPSPQAQPVNQQVICTWCILIGAQRATALCAVGCKMRLTLYSFWLGGNRSLRMLLWVYRCTWPCLKLEALPPSTINESES